MLCPYCAETVKDEAVACKHCGRDFSVVASIARELSEARIVISTLKSELSLARSAPPPSMPGAAAQARKSDVSDSGGGKRDAISKDIAQAAIVIDATAPAYPFYKICLMTWISLLAGHFLLIIVLDTPLIYLRLVSIGIPLLFGFVSNSAAGRWYLSGLLMGIAIAVPAVLMMSSVVSLVDGVPVIPKDWTSWHEWKEYAQYTASIGFGYFTGWILRRLLRALCSPAPLASTLIDLAFRYLARHSGTKEMGKNESVDELDLKLKKIETIVAAAMAAGSLGVSIYTGVIGLIK